MKTLLTSLFILMVSLSFGQTRPVTYVDMNGNTFEFANRLLIYTPSGTVGIYSGTTAKTVGLTPLDIERLETLFNTAIATTADHIGRKGLKSSRIKYKENNKNLIVHLKSGTASKNNIEASLLVILNR